jgi:hypothetical protein
MALTTYPRPGGSGLTAEGASVVGANQPESASTGRSCRLELTPSLE